eukprot:scaffold104311_cov22-Tisochrysis_lutea.AAC.2
MDHTAMGSQTSAAGVHSDELTEILCWSTQFPPYGEGSTLMDYTAMRSQTSVAGAHRFSLAKRAAPKRLFESNKCSLPNSPTPLGHLCTVATAPSRSNYTVLMRQPHFNCNCIHEAVSF